MAGREITGKHVLIGFVAAFGVIIGVNLVLAVSALRTFPGLEVSNSYVASQEFDDRKAAQEALGWTVRADHTGGLLILRITDEAGRPVAVADLDATVGRATHVQDDQTPDFSFDGTAYVAPVALAGGNWNVRMTARAKDGTLFEQRVVLHKD
ncbi:FixH family protein [Roseovarius sp. D22-M7]|uniref:FixH family protein n=1 Tax=Roseovarius sp. D22-M7 TaxID=3127116 RepID=UPI00300FDED2